MALTTRSTTSTKPAPPPPPFVAPAPAADMSPADPELSVFIPPTLAGRTALGMSPQQTSKPSSVGAHMATPAAPIDVVLDAATPTGRITADIPLASFTPPLTRDDVAGLVARVQVPLNSNGLFTPALVDKDGQTFLHVDVQGAEIAALERAPMLLVLGKPSEMGQTPPPGLVARGFKVVDSGKLRLQISAKSMRVDSTAPELASARANRDQSQRALDTFNQQRASTPADAAVRAALSKAVDDANGALAAATAALSVVRQKAEGLLATAPQLDVAVASSNVDVIATVATASTPAQIAQAAQTISSTYSALRAAHPEQADAWLAALDPGVASALSAHRAAGVDVDLAGRALARFDDEAGKRQGAGQASDALFASLTSDVAKKSQRVADLEAGRETDVNEVATTYDPSLRLG